MRTNTIGFLHCSKIGDLIYALPTIHALCDKSNAQAVIVCTRKEVVEAMGDLLMTHDEYIEDIMELKDAPMLTIGKNWVDLERFREHLDDHDATVSLPIAYARAFGVEDEVRERIKRPWIKVANPLYPEPVGKVVINWTPRYQDKIFNWEAEIRKYPPPYRFAGMSSEFRLFKKKYPYLAADCVPSKFIDYSEAATWLVNTQMFIGNQSSLFALAEALKSNRSLIEAPTPPNCRVSPEVVVNKFTRKLHKVVSLLQLIFRVITKKSH